MHEHRLACGLLLGLGWGLLLGLACWPLPALAQAPAPAVAITGRIDQISSWNRNTSVEDSAVGDKRDEEWYARTRARLFPEAKVGTTRFVLGLEIDAAWGQTGSADSTGNRSGTSGGWDLNTDTRTLVEVKHGYTEFDVPWVPGGTRLRLGAQPWAQTMKAGVLASGDFAGAHLSTTLTRGLGLALTYAQAEEKGPGVSYGFRGEDLAVLTSLVWAPLTGLEIRPIHAYLFVDGPTSSSARQGRGGVATGGFQNGDHEDRHTVGIDARWQHGPFRLEPTVLYQWGRRDFVATVGPKTGQRSGQEMSAWLVDVRGGWVLGPLLLEAAVIYTTGNKASEDVRDPRKDVGFYQPISTDGTFFETWNQLFAEGLDNQSTVLARADGLKTGTAIGYDKYGLLRLGARATYALTPALSLNAAASANWTAEKADTDGSLVNASGITPGDGHGDARYLGTEVDLGLTWALAPGLVLDVAGGYLFAGKALATRTALTQGGVTLDNRHPKDVQVVAARMRFSF